MKTKTALWSVSFQDAESASTEAVIETFIATRGIVTAKLLLRALITSKVPYFKMSTPVFIDMR